MEKNLTKFGYDNRYTINEAGEITNQKTKQKLTHRNYIFSLLDKDGNYKKVSLKTIYRKVFNTEFCVDNTITLDGEEWKPIDIDNRYLVSNYGRIKSRCGYIARILNPYTTEKGYLRVDIKRKGYLVHRLVYLTFTGEEAETIHHDNYTKKDNRLDNLQGKTRSEHAKQTQKDIKERKNKEQ